MEKLAQLQQRINRLLAKQLPAEKQPPQKLHAAMRYTTLSGGKRIRPLLVYSTGLSLGAKLEDLDIAALAVELVHSYSLIHDDLPAMDNDEMRRGQPTCHCQFDEATAILAGDTLFNLAFASLAQNHLDATTSRQMIATLTHACGSQGMAGGQALELEIPPAQLDLKQLETIHQLKTGALIAASIQLGAIIAQANQQQLALLTNYGHTIGLLFQIQDDIFDATTDDGRASYVTLMGLEPAKQRLQQLQQQATNLLQQLQLPNSLLSTLTKQINNRKH